MYTSQGDTPAAAAPTLGFWQVALTTAGKAAWDAYQGQGQCWTGYNKKMEEVCPGTPDYDAVARAVQKASDAEIKAIIGVLKATNSGRGPSSRSDLLKPECLPNWVKAMMGGGDCRASKIPEQPQMLLDLVERYGAPENAFQELPGSALETLKQPANIAPLVAGGLALFFLPKLF